MLEAMFGLHDVVYLRIKSFVLSSFYLDCSHL